MDIARNPRTGETTASQDATHPRPLFDEDGPVRDAVLAGRRRGLTVAETFQVRGAA